MKAPSKRGLFFLAGALVFALAGLEGAVTNISNSPNTVSMSPRVAVDTKGNIHVVWGEQNGSGGDCLYSFYDAASKKWSTPENISNSGRVRCDSTMTCDVGADASDRIYAVWVESSEIKMRTRSGGSWGEVTSVQYGQTRTDTPRIAVSSDGDVYVSWWALDGACYTRGRVGGSWERAVRISSGSWSKFPDIACGPGSVYAVLVEKGGDRYTAKICRRGRTNGAGWSELWTVSSSNLSQQHAVVAVDNSDVAHVIWTTVLDEAGARIVHYVNGTGPSFSSAVEISSMQVLHYPAMVRKGYNLYAVWQLGAWGGGQGVMYNVRRNGSWGSESYIGESQGATFCDVATNSDESAVYVVWDANNDIFINTAGGGGPGPSPNKPPVANFDYTPTTGEYPLDVTFDAYLSYDPDGSIAAYAWDFGDGGASTSKVAKHTFQSAGWFQVKLTVTDDKGATASVIKIVEVIKPNEPPTADFSFSPESGIYPLEVTFDASASVDPDGQVVGYEWDFGDGQKGGGQVVKHTYSKWGAYSIQLIVMDDRNATASKVKAITVLRLFQPLNIRWETHVDEGLFLTRYVTDVYWDRNPENDKLSKYCQIVKYNVYRKKSADDNQAYKIHVQLGADQFHYRDPDVGGVNVFTYTVTAVDNKGHESPIEGLSYGLTPALIRAPVKTAPPRIKIK